MFVSALNDSAQGSKSASSSNKQPFLPSESPKPPMFKAPPAPEKGDEMSGSYLFPLDALYLTLCPHYSWLTLTFEGKGAKFCEECGKFRNGARFCGD